MNVRELKMELDRFGVPPNFYSINGNLSSNTHILNQVYHYWEYFYFDEKGRTTGYRRFESEADACAYFYQVLKEEMRYYQPPHSPQ